MGCQARVGIPNESELGGALCRFRGYSGVCGHPDSTDRALRDFSSSLCGGRGLSCVSSAQRSAVLRGCGGDRAAVSHWFFLDFLIRRFLVFEERGFALRSLAWIYGSRADDRQPLSTGVSAEPRIALTLERRVYGAATDCPSFNCCGGARADALPRDSGRDGRDAAGLRSSRLLRRATNSH